MRKNPYNWELMVHCAGEQHIVRYKDGKLQFPNHGSSFKQFKTLWAMSGGQDCGCMAAVRQYRRLIDNQRNGAGQHSSALVYIGGKTETKGMEAWMRLSCQFTYATGHGRRLFNAALPAPPPMGLSSLSTKLWQKRYGVLEYAVMRFNEQASRLLGTRQVSLDKGQVSKERRAEVFSEPNLRGNSIGFNISLPVWSELVRKFGRSTLPSVGRTGDHQILLNARIVGVCADGLVTRFWGLSPVTGSRTPVIVTMERITSVNEHGLQQSWTGILTQADLTAKNLQKVYQND